MCKVIKGKESCGGDVSTLGRLRAKPSEPEAYEQEDEEKWPIERTESCRAYLRGVEPRKQEQYAERPEHHDDTAEFARNGAQNCIKRQQIPLRNDVGGSYQRIGFNVVVGMSEQVGMEEDKVGEQQQKHHDDETVFDRVVGMEGNSFLVDFFNVGAGWIAVAGNMQRPDMQQHDPHNHEGQEIMEREEAVEGRVLNLHHNNYVIIIFQLNQL